MRAKRRPPSLHYSRGCLGESCATSDKMQNALSFRGVRQAHRVRAGFDSSFKKRALSLLLAALGGALLGLVIVVAAPGNHVRRTARPPPPDLVRLAYMSVTQTYLFLTGTLTRSLFDYLAATAMAAFVGASLSPLDERAPAVWRGVLRTLVCLPLLAWALIATPHAAAAYGLSGPPRERSLLVPQYVLSCTALVWGCAAGIAARRIDLEAALGQEARLWRGLVVAGTFVALLVSSLHAAWQTLVKEVQLATYAEAWDARDRLIRDAKGKGLQRVSVLPLQNPYRCEEVESDPKWWTNECVSAYYGQTVIAHPAPAAPADEEIANMIPIDAQIGKGSTSSWVLAQADACAQPQADRNGLLAAGGGHRAAVHRLRPSVQPEDWYHSPGGQLPIGRDVSDDALGLPQRVRRQVRALAAP